MFFFPYGTDAPIYYWPIITVLMIAVNVMACLWEFTHPGQEVKQYILAYGQGLIPYQWVTSNFLHAGIGHLVGNMVYLWSFGLVIEGKLGWWKMLIIYLGIGILGCAIEQFIMQNAVDAGGSLGASGIIFGLMAMGLIWAPENEVQFTWGYYGFGWGMNTGEFEIKIVTLVWLMILYQIIIQCFVGFSISSAALHLIGAGIGFAVAIAMLKLKMVDCENWDAFSVWAGKNTKTLREREETERELLSEEDELKAKKRMAEEAEQRKIDEKKSRELALREIHELICSGQSRFAMTAHLHMLNEYPDWRLPDDDLFGLIMALQREKLWTESVPLMAEYLERNPEGNSLMALKLAQILVVAQKRPAQALKVIAKIDETELDEGQRAFLNKLRAKAEELQEAGPYEIAGE
jgi:membrane associated rhomboid family serine protease